MKKIGHIESGGNHLTIRFGADKKGAYVEIGVDNKNGKHVVLKPTELMCLCCGEHVFIHPRLTLETLEAFVKAFEEIHNKAGCTEEEYLKNKIMEDV